jgi:hypothetical protein
MTDHILNQEESLIKLARWQQLTAVHRNYSRKIAQKGDLKRKMV